VTAFDDLSRTLTRTTGTPAASAIPGLLEALAGATAALTARMHGSPAVTADTVREALADTVLALVVPHGHRCPPASPPLRPGETSVGRELLDECARIAQALPEEELLLEEQLVDLLRADLAHPWSRQGAYGLDSAHLAGSLARYGVRTVAAPATAPMEPSAGRRAYRRADLLSARPEPPDPGVEAALRRAA